jgi:nitrogen regulatory protein PII
MKRVEAVIRPEREQEVTSALVKAGIHPFTRSYFFEVGQRTGLEPTRTDEIPWVGLMIAVANEDLDRTLDSIRQAAQTGKPGDGKIFVSPLAEVWKIR